MKSEKYLRREENNQQGITVRYVVKSEECKRIQTAVVLQRFVYYLSNTHQKRTPILNPIPLYLILSGSARISNKRSFIEFEIVVR